MQDQIVIEMFKQLSNGSGWKTVMGGICALTRVCACMRILICFTSWYFTVDTSVSFLVLRNYRMKSDFLLNNF